MSTLTYHGQFQSHILSTGTGPAAIGISVSDFLRLQNNNIHVLQLDVIDATFSGKGMYMLWLPKMNKAFESIIPGRWSFFSDGGQYAHCPPLELSCSESWMGNFVLKMEHLQFTDLIHVAATSWINVSFAIIECPVKAQICNSSPFCALSTWRFK